MFTVIADLFDALSHFKPTSPWTEIVSLWLTNHYSLRGAKHFSIQGRFSHILRHVSDSVIKLSRFQARKANFRADVWWKPFDLVSPYNVIRSIEAPKTHSIIFSKSTMVVTHNRVTGLLAAKWISKTKTCSNQFSTPRDIYTFNTAKETCPYLSKLEFHR